MSTVSRRDAGEIAVVNVLGAAIAFTAGVVIARRFGEIGRGELTAVMLWPSVGLVVGGFGLSTAATFFVAQDRDQRAQVVGTAAVLTAFTSVAAAGLTAVVILVALADEPSDVRQAALCFVPIVVIHPLLGVLYHPWRVMDRVRRWNLCRLAVDSSLLVALVITIVAGTTDYRVLMVVQVAGITVLAVVAATAWSGGGRRLRFVRHEGRRLLRYGAPTLLATLPYLLNFRVDQAFLTANSSAAELGGYAVAVGWSLGVLPILVTVTHLALPRIAASGSTSVAASHVRLGSTVAVCAALTLSAVSPFAVPFVFGPEFETSGRLALVLVPATAVLGLCSVLEEVLRSLGRATRPAAAQAIGLAVTLALLPWATAAHGAWGAAVVSVVAYTTTLVTLLRMVAGACHVRVRELLVLRPSEIRPLLGARRGRRSRDGDNDDQVPLSTSASGAEDE